MKQNVYIQIAILLGGVVIAGGIFFINTVGSQGTTYAHAVERMKGAHVNGDPKAPVTIVEFSDFECPFCARLHPTLERIVEESEGAIKWEYRHLPLAMHRHALPAAYASECVSILAGSEAFWTFIDVLFANQRNLGEELYVAEAAKLGITRAALTACMKDDDIHAAIDADIAAATAHGGSGTPFSVIVFEDGSTKPISGALPYTQWQALLGL